MQLNHTTVELTGKLEKRNPPPQVNVVGNTKLPGEIIECRAMSLNHLWGEEGGPQPYFGGFDRSFLDDRGQHGQITCLKRNGWQAASFKGRLKFFGVGGGCHRPGICCSFDARTAQIVACALVVLVHALPNSALDAQGIFHEGMDGDRMIIPGDVLFPHCPWQGT